MQVKRGRKSFSEVSAVTQVASISRDSRLVCPVHLSDAVHAVWAQLVNDQPADAFAQTHVPMIEQYCRHIVQSRVLSDKIDTFQPEWLDTDDGLKRYDRLLGAHEREGRAASSLATRLRITRQAVEHRQVVGTKQRANQAKTSKPWELGTK